MTLRQLILIGTHLAAIVLGWSLHYGLIYQPHLRKDAEAVVRVEQAGRKLEGVSQAITQAARDKADTKQETIRGTTQAIVKAIPAYLPQRSPGGGGPGVGPDGAALAEGDVGSGRGDTALPVGFGRLHDYAALGIDPPVPEPSREPLSASSGIDLPGLAETVVTNYGVCQAAIAGEEAWKEWYREQEAVWNTHSK